MREQKSNLTSKKTVSLLSKKLTTFRTSITIPTADFSLTHQNRILSIGSCFAEHIGHRLRRLKFNLNLNPYGILYNPMSIAKGLKRLITLELIEETDLFHHNDLWQHFDFHGRFSNMNKTIALQEMNTSIQNAHLQIQQLDTLILTFGTAYVFEHIEQQQVVGNCHKLPNRDFKRCLLSLTEIEAAILPILKELQAFRPNLNIILTVSPIRHIRDGLIENQRSKATLLLAVQAIQQQLSKVYYFPSYEIMMDDLRDYRFYGADMIHPNEVALDYIWDKFATTFFNPKTLQLNKALVKLQKAMEHRPFNPTSNKHQAFLKKQLHLIEQLEKQYGDLNFEKEKEWLTDARFSLDG